MSAKSAFFTALARTASVAVEAAGQAQASKPGKRKKKEGCTPCEARGNVLTIKEGLFG